MKHQTVTTLGQSISDLHLLAGTKKLNEIMSNFISTIELEYVQQGYDTKILAEFIIWYKVFNFIYLLATGFIYRQAFSSKIKSKTFGISSINRRSKGI